MNNIISELLLCITAALIIASLWASGPWWKWIIAAGVTLIAAAATDDNQEES